MKNNKGFTMLELIAVIVIMLIISAMAIPAYNNYVLYAKRTEVKSKLLEISSAMDGSRIITNNSYTMKQALLALGDDPGGKLSNPYLFPIANPKYQIVFTPTTIDGKDLNNDPSFFLGFKLTAKAINTQTKDFCGVLSITNTIRTSSKTAKDKNGADTKECW